ncbi:hypothetical protein [Pseudodesulfovibrio senegalensis]|uniref:Uncharacterized protein n=1 Tax=Pseudodesulfovibrio senegalensis TaxID=1721087 RepID=A0A6N6N6H4_9BACT|nr:hypothetical protein [Pseudodesulfovibrio senegalensis]KAB1443085.1 hypothetical protein F8A88_02130 [Pseudodesulfovibrio senegalensis]
MISTVIIDHIATNVPDLTTGENLFAEQSKGNQTVTVITRDLAPWPGMPQNFRKALIEVEVKGYSMQEAHALAEGLLPHVNGLQHTTFEANGKTYKTSSIENRMCPRFVGDNTVTFSFALYFVVEGA